MHKDFCLPDLGEGLTSAILRDWHVREGQLVKADQKLCSVETSKAIVDIPVPFSGQLISLSAQEGNTINTGSILCTIIPSENSAKSEPISFEKNQRASIANIMQHSTNGMSPNRAAMFDNLVRAHLQVATATLTESAQIKKKANTSTLLWLLIQTLKQHKIFNASYSKRDGLIYHDNIDIGIAVQGEHGLFHACIANSETFTLEALSEQIKNLKNSPKSNNIARMTLSNIGSTGIGLYATPSIIPPGLATLAIGRTEIKPVWDENTEQWQPVTTVPLSLSFDHRIITGVEAAEFLRSFISKLI